MRAYDIDNWAFNSEFLQKFSLTCSYFNWCACWNFRNLQHLKDNNLLSFKFQMLFRKSFFATWLIYEKLPTMKRIELDRKKTHTYVGTKLKLADCRRSWHQFAFSVDLLNLSELRKKYVGNIVVCFNREIFVVFTKAQNAYKWLRIP